MIQIIFKKTKTAKKKENKTSKYKVLLYIDLDCRLSTKNCPVD